MLLFASLHFRDRCFVLTLRTVDDLTFCSFLLLSLRQINFGHFDFMNGDVACVSSFSVLGRFFVQFFLFRPRPLHA
jgi:hypothetical protein